ncbi:fibroin heavy chain-like [Suncus etruscus]|uniref:fibroin heavy chain-like n=1 Tax=Suncus etruscus TaxID=109475 RepID=UPI00210F94A4|nr:fibroin heavy chain-like [Suncus etruscus]
MHLKRSLRAAAFLLAPAARSRLSSGERRRSTRSSSERPDYAHMRTALVALDHLSGLLGRRRKKKARIWGEGCGGPCAEGKGAGARRGEAAVPGFGAGAQAAGCVLGVSPPQRPSELVTWVASMTPGAGLGERGSSGGGGGGGGGGRGGACPGRVGAAGQPARCRGPRRWGGGAASSGTPPGVRGGGGGGGRGGPIGVAGGARTPARRPCGPLRPLWPLCRARTGERERERASERASARSPEYGETEAVGKEAGATFSARSGCGETDWLQSAGGGEAKALARAPARTCQPRESAGRAGARPGTAPSRHTVSVAFAPRWPGCGRGRVSGVGRGALPRLQLVYSNRPELGETAMGIRGGAAVCLLPSLLPSRLASPRTRVCVCQSGSWVWLPARPGPDAPFSLAPAVAAPEAGREVEAGGGGDREAPEPGIRRAPRASRCAGSGVCVFRVGSGSFGRGSAHRATTVRESFRAGGFLSARPA